MTNTLLEKLKKEIEYLTTAYEIDNLMAMSQILATIIYITKYAREKVKERIKQESE